jgi:hypothetical protein
VKRSNLVETVFMAGLAAVLQDELDRRGWNWSKLADKSKIGESTLSKWRHHPEVVPDLRSLAVLSATLELPLRQLIEACGFAVNESAGYADREARARALVAAVPQLAVFADPLASLTPEDQDAVWSMVETYLQRRRKG